MLTGMISRDHVKQPFVRNGPVSNRMPGAVGHSQPAPAPAAVPEAEAQPEAPEAVEAAPAPAKKPVAKKSSAKK